MSQHFSRNYAAVLPFWGLRDDNGARDGTRKPEKVAVSPPTRPAILKTVVMLLKKRLLSSFRACRFILPSVKRNLSGRTLPEHSAVVSSQGER